MVVCPVCDTPLAGPRYRCPRADFEPAMRNGFLAWATELADTSDGFHAEDFANLAPMEARHFWFRARNQLILWALRRYAPAMRSFLEIGCGTGFVLSGVAQAFPGVRLVGTEVFVEGLAYAAQRAPGAELMQMDARHLPYVEEFDVVAAFDVIEHIEDDLAVLRNLHRTVKAGGHCIVSVPQHMWLWSPVDEEACHKRRYTRGELERKAASVGLETLRSTSFVSLLLPLLLVSRAMDRRRGRSGGTGSLAVNVGVNRLLESVLALERAMIKGGASLPLGGSRLIVMKKA